MIETDGIFDWETNGINNGFRYPHQIAIIDNDNENRLEIKNFRIPHYELPSPYALAATSMNWKKLKEGPSLYETLPEILDILLDYDILWAYNSQYDTGVLTEALYACGHFPYLYKDKVVCDALPFVSLAAKLFPETLSIPKKSDGKLSHKLADVFNQNFEKDNSIIWHQADGDVRATSRLLNKIKKEIPEFWEFRSRMFSKFARQDMFNDLSIWARYYYPNQQISPMLPIYERDRDNYFSIDILKYEASGGLSKKNIEKIINYSKDNNKKLPDWLHATYLKTPGLIFNPDWFNLKLDYILPQDSEIKEIYNLIDQYIPGPKIWPKKNIQYLEEDFFGFPSSQDRLAWDSFHKSNNWDEKIQIKFKDQKSKRVAQRIIFDNAPETLDDQPYKVIIEFIKARWKNNDHKVPWVTVSKALEGIATLEKEEKLEIFEGYKEYLLSLNQEL